MNVYNLHGLCFVWCHACIYRAATLCIYSTTQCNITADSWLCSYCHDKVTLHSVCNGLNWV